MKKALVIVDVQTSFGKYYSYSYLKKVYSFIRNNTKNYEKIYSLYQPLIDIDLELAEDSMVSFITDNSIPICKMYDDNYTFSLINKDELDKYNSSLKFEYENKLERVVKLFKNLNTDTIKVSNGELLLRKLDYYILPERSHRVEFISNQMLDMIKDLQENKYEVDIIGGGLTKCVSITHDILNIKGIKCNVLDKLCYDIFFINSNKHDNIFKKKPSKSLFKKDLLNNDGFLRLIEMPISI